MTWESKAPQHLQLWNFQKPGPSHALEIYSQQNHSFEELSFDFHQNTS